MVLVYNETCCFVIAVPLPSIIQILPTGYLARLYLFSVEPTYTLVMETKLAVRHQVKWL